MKQQSLGDLASRYAPRLYANYLARERARQLKRVERVLARSGEPAVLGRDDSARLMERVFPQAASYDYDLFSSTARAAGRVERLAKLFPMLKEPRRVLELSTGDGLVGALLSVGGHEVTLSDLRDWRAAPARGTDFVEWDVSDAPPLERGSFDLVIAYNATEHWPAPPVAVHHALELCRRDGYLLLDFGPLYNSPWGMHAWSLGVPYPQFLFSEEYVKAQVGRLGIHDLGRDGDSLQPTNGWSLAQFRALWNQCGARVVSNFEDRDFRYLDLIEEFAPCFRGRGLSLEEVTVNSIEVVLQKV